MSMKLSSVASETEAQVVEESGQVELETATTEPETPASFEEWLGTQDESIQALFEAHVAGLKSALVSERKSRGNLEKEVRKLSTQSSQGENVAKELSSLTEKLEESSLRLAFYESAPADLVNPKLGFIAARESNLLQEGGSVDWGRLKTEYPQLFRRVPSANAGTGSAQKGPEKSMNTFIRSAAGVR